MDVKKTKLDNISENILEAVKRTEKALELIKNLMDVKKTKLDNISENILEAVKNTEKALELFKDERQNFRKSSNDYDFEDYSNLDIFIEIEKENIEKLQSFDRRLKFNNIRMHLKETMNNLKNKQKDMYDNFKSSFTNLSNEIHATSSVLSFLSYWNEKNADNFELQEYPNKFLKCLGLVPQNCRLQIEKDLSIIKRLPGHSDNDIMISSKILDWSDHRLNEIEENDKSESSRFLFSDDSTLNEDMLKIKDKNTNFNRGNTLKLNISVLDYTINCGKDGSFPSKPSPCFEQSFEPELLTESDDNDEDDNDEDDNNVLNTAVHEISDDDVILAASPDFTHSGNLKHDLSDSCYPEIEKWHPAPEEDVTFNLTLEIPMDMSEIQDSYILPLNDSQTSQDSQSDSEPREEDQENQSNHLDSTDFSFMDTSKFTLGYSFNNNSNVKLQHIDNDD